MRREPGAPLAPPCPQRATAQVELPAMGRALEGQSPLMPSFCAQISAPPRGAAVPHSGRCPIKGTHPPKAGEGETLAESDEGVVQWRGGAGAAKDQRIMRGGEQRDGEWSAVTVGISFRSAPGALHFVGGNPPIRSCRAQGERLSWHMVGKVAVGLLGVRARCAIARGLRPCTTEGI